MPTSNPLPTLVVVLVAALVAAGCGWREPGGSGSGPPSAEGKPGMDPARKVEVKVMADGSLFIDDRPVTLKSMDRRFAKLAKSNGLVWYYREAGHAPPPPVAAEVIRLVMKHRLPISLSSQPDFSDTIDANGIAHPRRSGG